MLVLTRKRKQGIRIGETINLQVLEIHGTRVTIGISGPREVKVLRGEICPPRSNGPNASDADESDRRRGP